MSLFGTMSNGMPPIAKIFARIRPVFYLFLQFEERELKIFM